MDNYGITSANEQATQAPFNTAGAACIPAERGSIAPPAENKIRRIVIEQLNHGYIVGVGCHQFAFESKETMIEKLSEYINEPADTEKKWFAKELF